jgi:hypothetical protein
MAAMGLYVSGSVFSFAGPMAQFARKKYREERHERLRKLPRDGTDVPPTSKA